jgi:hypothetical protein
MSMRPVLLHVKTVKGNGYEVAATEPTKFHSPSPFSVNGCRVEINKGTGKSWTAAYADAMIALAKKDPRVVALTAAMPDGTGLSKFEKEIPGRYYDTGICESHLAAMAAGMCKSGMRPFAAIYSTFMQRAFDQVWQEIALNGLPVVFCMDRAGFVGDDGAVHHGFMDQAFLRPMPGMVLMAPSDEAELNRACRLGLTLETPAAIRYPRDNVPAVNFEDEIEHALRAEAKEEWTVGRSRVLREGSDATLIVYGALAQKRHDRRRAVGLRRSQRRGDRCPLLQAGRWRDARPRPQARPSGADDRRPLAPERLRRRRDRIRRRPPVTDRWHHAPGHPGSPDRSRDPQGAARRSRPRRHGHRPQRARRHPRRADRGERRRGSIAIELRDALV